MNRLKSLKENLSKLTTLKEKDAATIKGGHHGDDKKKPLPGG